MSTPHIEQSLPLDLLRRLLSALPKPTDETPERRHARIGDTRAALAAFKPRDAIEAMLAAEAIATHGAVMECYRLALAGDLSGDAARRQRATAATLVRCLRDTLRLLAQRQAEPLPVVAGALVVAEADDDDLDPPRAEDPMHREAAVTAPARAPVAQFTPVVSLRIVELMTPAERRAFYGYPEDVNQAVEAANRAAEAAAHTP